MLLQFFQNVRFARKRVEERVLAEEAFQLRKLHSEHATKPIFSSAAWRATSMLNPIQPAAYRYPSDAYAREQTSDGE
jgi:hypothetical protein